jgi:uncharacterized protein YaaN involved in tellurite resistance
MMDDEVKKVQADIPTLMFGTESTQPKKEPEETVTDAEGNVSVQIDDSILSEEEKQAVVAFAGQIDVRNTQAIMEYGAGVQKRMADFSQETLNTVRAKDLGKIGDLLTQVSVQVKEFDNELQPKSGFLGMFKKAKVKLSAVKAKYDKTEVTLNEICNNLEDHQTTLLKDVQVLDQMYDLNLQSYKEITMYILAGKKHLEEVRDGELAELKRIAEETGKAEDAQKFRDLSDQCDRFEKKIYDLELTRTISMQTAPQIRMVQSSDTMMAEKIQSTIVNTIPLWKNQMVIALGVEHATEAAKAQREVSEMTNALLKKNADKLKVATIEAAKESERGIVDLETLKHTNETLISTLDEVLVIQTEGRAKRAAAEQELANMETELKDKLLDIAKRQ